MAARAGAEGGLAWARQTVDGELWPLVVAGRLDAVEAELRRRVFFEPGNALWRFQLGAVLWEQGWLQRAGRELAQARRLLDGAPSAGAVSGGCTAAELRQLLDDWRTVHG